ncbi:carbon-nitrogen hydrolase family protein [Planomonospora alba]
MLLRTAVAQIPVTWDVEKNLAEIARVVESCAGDDLVVLPEGALSGYGADLSPLDRLDPAKLNAAAGELAALARRTGVHLICGSLLYSDDRWWNGALVVTPGGARRPYRKVNLAVSERGVLGAGSDLPVHRLACAGGAVDVGVQICREIRFPEQWRHLVGSGAQVFAYLTHAANPDEPPGVWRAHLVSRAAENQRWLLAANAADAASHCPTMIVSPRGEVVAETAGGQRAVLRATIDLAAVSDWYLGQRRDDVLESRYHGGPDGPDDREGGRRRPGR